MKTERAWKAMLWAIAAYILQGIICASLSDGLSKRKGYIGARFATIGFFLGIFGLLYAMGLPLERDDDIERIRNPRNASNDQAIEERIELPQRIRS